MQQHMDLELIKTQLGLTKLIGADYREVDNQ